MLYGNNVFRFDDHPHNSDEHTMPAFNTSVPYCDYLTMYFFLVSIGKSNREKLQHIHLDFSEATFVRYPEEVGIYGNLRENAGASFIGDAVELLAASHNLQTVSVSFNATSVSQKDKWSYSSAMLDYFYICSKLARKISAITGIEQFKCLTTYEAREDEYDGFFCKAVKDMKAKMEVRYPPPLNPLSRLTYDREPIAQVEGGRGSGTKVVGNRSPLSPTKVSNDFCPRPSGVTKDAARAGSTDDGNATKATTTIWSEAQSMPTSRRPLIQEPGQDLPAA